MSKNVKTFVKSLAASAAKAQDLQSRLKLATVMGKMSPDKLTPLYIAHLQAYIDANRKPQTLLTIGYGESAPIIAEEALRKEGVGRS